MWAGTEINESLTSWPDLILHSIWFKAVQIQRSVGQTNVTHTGPVAQQQTEQLKWGLCFPTFIHRCRYYIDYVQTESKLFRFLWTQKSWIFLFSDTKIRCDSSCLSVIGWHSEKQLEINVCCHVSVFAHTSAIITLYDNIMCLQLVWLPPKAPPF